MQRSMQRTSLAAAASLLILAGGVPAWASDGTACGSEPPSGKASSGESRRAAQRAAQRSERELKKCGERMRGGLELSMRESFKAARALAEGEWTQDDVAALQSSFDAALSEAVAAALARIDAREAALVAMLKEKGASDRLLARVASMAERMRERTNAKAGKISERWGELMDELFMPTSEDSGGLADDGDAAPPADSPPGSDDPPGAEQPASGGEPPSGDPQPESGAG